MQQRTICAAPLVNETGKSLAVLEWLLLAALLVVFGWRAILPAWRTINTDFPNYYLAASLSRQGIPLDRAYEWRWFQRHKDHAQIDQPLVGFAPHPPLCAAPMLPLTQLPALEAKRVWLVLNLGFLALSLWLLHCVTQLSWRRLLLLAFCCVDPLRQNFLFGQYYIFILLLLCLAYYAHCRGRRFASGTVLGAAASLKIFPALFLLLFLRKRNWRAAAGLAVGAVLLTAGSVPLFGWDVQRVYLLEVLPRALRGEVLAPYNLQWNSFGALWHHLFLPEPGMNASPVWNSPGAFALLQALTTTALLFGFLLRTSDEETPASAAREWTAFVPLFLLLSSMPSPYHYCVLIFATIVSIDELLKRDARRAALIVALLYAAACLPLPPNPWLRFQGRLVSLLLFYLVLLFKLPVHTSAHARRIQYAMAGALVVAMTLSNLRLQKNRSEDFARRISDAREIFAAFAVAPTQSGLVLDEMYLSADLQAYRALRLPEKDLLPLSAPGDVLSIAASPDSPFLYFELAGRYSQIFRLRISPRPADRALEHIADGQDPVLSPDGHWLAFLKADYGGSTIWLSKDGAPAVRAPGSQTLQGVLEMAVTNEGDVIVAAGNAANSRLAVLHMGSGQTENLSRIVGSVRYPALSSDGRRLAFSRREGGSWHLFVREFAPGLGQASAAESEQQLTTGACNTTYPAWENQRSLLYVTDCGRGLGLGAVARVLVTP